MTVAEIADYLKLLGFIIEQHSDTTCILYPVSPTYIDTLADIWDGVGLVGLYTYGDCTILLDALSRSYEVTECMRNYYAIADFNSGRSS